MSDGNCILQIFKHSILKLFSKAKIKTGKKDLLLGFMLVVGLPENPTFDLVVNSAF